jgi:alcohol/geraniol dehydrogenase (NADP+)
MTTIDAWVAPTAKSKLVRQQVEIGPLGDEEAEVEVEHCGLCHSDLSMRNNDWGFSQFPAVLGHEAVGRVVEVGRAAKGLTVGQRNNRWAMCPGRQVDRGQEGLGGLGLRLGH